MIMKCLFLFIGLSCVSFMNTVDSMPVKKISNQFYSILWDEKDVTHFSYKIRNDEELFNITLPFFEIEKKKTQAILKYLKPTAKPIRLNNGVTEYSFEGPFATNATLSLLVTFQVSTDNPVIRFKYTLKSSDSLKLTKTGGKDNINYLTFFTESSNIKEVRFSEFNERFHATHLTEVQWDQRHFANGISFMGPMAVFRQKQNSFLLAYEHGSQYPDRYFEFQLHENRKIDLKAVKGNYLDGQDVNEFSSVWFDLAGVKGNEDMLASDFRDFMLRYINQNSASRQPVISYNTWGRQERVYWRGGKYLSSLNLDITLKDIDRAHQLGVEVYVVDMGWFEKAGDWTVNKKLFPDELKQVKAKLDSYGMHLGLWFNPTVAAVSSDMYRKNESNRMSKNGKYSGAAPVWETEESYKMCMVSSYWEDFADKLIDLCENYGVSWIKWDAVSQYGCDAANHFHGTQKDSQEERAYRYSYLQPFYFAKIIDKVCKARPECIFEFDITEAGRCVGLQYLASGKYYLMNNGPYYGSFNLPDPGKNANILVAPGPARGWFTRSVLDYDQWIPSVLFLTHYQFDGDENSQLINMASLILGQNGVWGEIMEVSDSGVSYVNSLMEKYKMVRNEITAGSIVFTGENGGGCEIYEKINPRTGKGCISAFGNKEGEYIYITKNKIDKKIWQTPAVKVEPNKTGGARITFTFKKASASIIFFGIEN